MNKKSIRVSDAIPEMPLSFEQTVERTLHKVCTEQERSIPTLEEIAESQKHPRSRRERVQRIFVGFAAAILVVLSLGIVSIVVVRGLQNKQYEAAQPGNRVSETSSEQSSATDAITEHTYRIELCPSFDENTEPVSPEPAQENKISEKLRTALETTTEESLDLYVWFKDDGIEEAVQEKMQRTDPELYELYRKKLNNEPMTDAETDRVIEGARAVHTEVYQSMNRDRLNANLTDGQILYLGAYGPMCIVSMPTVMVEGLAESGGVVYLDLFENMTSTPSAEGDGVGLSAIRMSITELDVNPGTLQWTTELRLKKNGEAENPFTALTRILRGEARCKFYNADGLLTEDAGAKLVELASPGDIAATEDEADWIVRIPSVAAMPQVYDSFPAALPPTGEVTVEQTFFLVDAAADGEGLPVLLSRVYQSFTFDAEKLLNVKDPAHIDVPLSGEIILTVRKETGYQNERAALDGVTLDAEIHYTKTGIFVIVSIKEPASITEAQQDALLQAMNNPWNVNDCALACVDAKGDQRTVYHLSRAFWGTTKLARFEALVLPVEYASAQTLEFGLSAFCVTGEKGGERNEDWHWDVKDGALPELLTERQSLGTFTLPLTEATQTAGTDTPVKAIRYHGMIYVTTGREAAGEFAESAIRKAEEMPVPASQWPTAEGQTNFGDQPVSYAMAEDGLAVLVGSEWTLFEPLLPDANRGVFEAAYAQVLLEQYEFDRTYDVRRAKMETMSEEEAQDYDTIMEGEENFLHQRFVRLQRISEVTVSVEQQVDRMRLSEIAYLDGRLYFAFAATKVWAFDAEPEICINGTQYNAIDDSGFFALKETETEQYAFYEIEPGTLSGTVQITAKNNDHAFRFMYNVEDRTVALSQDEATPQSDVSYYFLVNSVPVYPYEGFVWESKPELEADGVGVRLEDEKVRSEIPVTEYNVGMSLVVLTADGWKLNEIIVFDAAYERIVDVAGSKIPWKEGYGYVATDLLQTLSPGTYYVSATVSYRTEDYSIGNEIVICLRVKEASETPEPTEEPPMQETSVIPSTFRFWDYDEENGYREAPTEGVLFVCDFDGDGTKDEVAYKIHGQYVTISLGIKSIDVDFGAGLEQAILLDLDPDSARLNLLVVYNTGSEDYETAELHMENGRFVRGPVIWAYCSFDGNTVRGSATQTDILGTRLGGRTYHGEKLTPDSEWFDCDVIPDEIQSASDRARLIEDGKLLHLVRDLPCTIDGADAVIPAGSYIYMTRWHESGTLAEIRTEDGTTALLTVERANPLDPELYGYLIDGATQDTYFDNIFYAD